MPSSRKNTIHVAVGRIQLELPACHSLKAKRKVVRPLVARIRDRFGISAAEVGMHDLWHSALIAVAAVGSTPSQLDGLLQDVMGFIQRSVDGVVASFGVEVLSLGELHQSPAPDREADVDASSIEDDWLREES